jgi:hypothetical protein
VSVGFCVDFFVRPSTLLLNNPDANKDSTMHREISCNVSGQFFHTAAATAAVRFTSILLFSDFQVALISSIFSKYKLIKVFVNKFFL